MPEEGEGLKRWQTDQIRVVGTVAYNCLPEIVKKVSSSDSGEKVGNITHNKPQLPGFTQFKICLYLSLCRFTSLECFVAGRSFAQDGVTFPGQKGAVLVDQ